MTPRGFLERTFWEKLVDEQKVADGARFPLISQTVEQKPIR
jgi:hypothetical protein